MNFVIRSLLLFFVLSLIPLVGFFINDWIASYIVTETKSDSLHELISFCVFEKNNPVCQDLHYIVFLKNFSLYLIVGVFLFIILFSIISMVIGYNRRWLALSFPVMIRVSYVVLSLLVIVQGLIISSTLYYGEVYWLGLFHPKLILVMCLLALSTAIILITSSWSLFSKKEILISGVVLNRDDSSNLFEFIEKIANKIHARMPDNIVVGFETNFYITGADVRILEKESFLLKGETLYISSLLVRILSIEELTSVIGHELGHYRGDDTIYSLKFSPIYSNLEKTILDLRKGRDVEKEESNFFALPALLFLDYIYDIFSCKESFIRRKRELEADKAGTEAGSAISLITALVKITLFASFWSDVRKENIIRLNKGKISNNLSNIFQEKIKYEFNFNDYEDILDFALKNRSQHPTDTHPILSDRVNALGVDKSLIKEKLILLPEESSECLIDNYDFIEEELSMQEHTSIVSLGLANIPEIDEEEDYLLNITYTLAAKIICADKKITQDEILIAENIGKKLFGEDVFDSIDFRTICRNVNQNDDVDFLNIIVLLKEALPVEERKLIHNFLLDIANADEHICEAEKKLLEIVTNQLY